MPNLKKLFISSMIVAVTAWAMGLAAIPMSVKAASAGDLIKEDGLSSVYYLGADGKRYVFPNETTYFSWYSDFSSVVTVSKSELESYPLGSNITIRPGTKLVKITTDPKVYAVEPNGVLKHIATEEAAKKLYGDNWAKRVVDVPDAFFTNYTVSSDSIDGTTYPVGSLIKYDGSSDVYYVDSTGKRKIKDEAAFTANRFQWSNIITAPSTIKIKDGKEIAGAESSLIDTSQGGGAGKTATTGTGLTVALSSDTPTSPTIVAGQAIADLAHLTFTNGDAKDVKVTSLKIKRIGASTDATLSDVYLFKGNDRLTDAATVNSGYATFNSAAGLFTIPANSSVVIAIKSDISDDSSGKIVGVAINAASDITSDASKIKATFPIEGNLMSITNGNDLSTVSFGTASPTGTDLTVNPGETNYSVWKSTATISNHNVNLKYLRLREIGSVATNDLQNFNLYVNNTKVAGPVQMGDDYYVTFDLGSNPITLETGNRTIEVKADVVSGSSRSYSFSLRTSADINLEDNEYGVSVIPAGLPATTDSREINSGSMTIVKATDSPSDQVIQNANNVVVAKYTLTAYGEKIKVESLKVKTSNSDGLDNGRLYVNGSQIGSTLDIAAGGTTYNLGSSLIVEPGKPVTLEVRADIKDENSNTLTGNFTVTLVKGDKNAQAMDSLKLLNAPSGDKPANQLTVVTGSLAVAKNTSYSNQNTIAGVSKYKLGSYIITVAAGEDVNISSFTVGITGGDLTKLTNLYVTYGKSSTTPKDEVSSTNSFSISHTMSANSQMIVNIYANISSDASTNTTYTTSLDVSATTAQSEANAYDGGAVTGQTITLKEATMAVALDSSRPDAALVVANSSGVKAAAYKFTASNADITVKDINVKLVNPDSVNTVVGAKLDLNNDGTPDTSLVYPVLTTYETISNVTAGSTLTVADATKYTVGDILVLSDSSASEIRTISSINTGAKTLTFSSAFTVSGTVSVSSYVYPFTGVNIVAKKDTPTIVGVYLDLNDVTTNGTSGADAKVALYSFKQLVGGTESTAYAATADFTGIPGASQIVRRTIPTLTLDSATPSGTLVAGAKTNVLTVDVAADSAYEVQVNSVQFTPAIAGTVSGGDGIYVYDKNGNLKGSALDEGTTDLAISVGAGATTTTIDVDSATEVAKYQIGERVDITGGTDISGAGQTIMAISGTTLTVSPGVKNNGNAAENITTITPKGYTTGHAYQIALSNFVVPAGGSDELVVKADTSGLTTSGNYVRFDIASDALTGTTGNLVWTDGTTPGANINGYLVKNLPITGKTLLTQ